MTDQPVTHATFTLERTYPAEPARVFAAWADPAAKARWFASPGAGHQLDFRVGGTELTSGAGPDGQPLSYASTYHDIAGAERIVFSSVLSVADRPATVSLTTVELAAAGTGTRLVLTEQGAYLDALEQPSWREQGTSGQLDALGKMLADGQ